MQERFTNFTVLISKITRNIKKIKSNEMLEYDLKGNHLSVLYYIYKLNSLTLAELCDITTEDKAGLSRAVDELVSRQLVRKTANTTYRNMLQLTPNGIEIATAIASKIEDIIDISSQGISEPNKAVMYQCLAQINKNLDNYANIYEED